MNPVMPPRDELRAYRDRTIALLRRYFMLSIETGRLPSLLGREFFRAKCSSYRLVTFEDAVIFVHDIEHCLDRLDDFERQILARIVLQGHSEGQTAWFLHTDRRTIERRYPEALDDLSAVFLRVGMMALLPMHEPGWRSPGAHCDTARCGAVPSQGSACNAQEKAPHP